MSQTGAHPQERRIGPRWAAMLAPLVLGFVVSVVLAYQSFDTRRQHRATARATAREHAGFAAFLIASSVDREMQQTLLYSFYPVDLARDRDPGSSPDPAVLRTEPEASRCAPLLSAEERRFFSFDMGTGELVVDGPYRPGFDAWITEAIQANGDADVRGPRHIAGNDGPSLVTYRIWSDPLQSIAYGFDSCWQTEEGNVFQAAVKATQALPPSLVGETPNDSLFTLTARDGTGRLVYGEHWVRPGSNALTNPQYYGTVPVRPTAQYGGLELRVTLLSTVAERLIRGGVPQSRLPLALGLVLLTGGLMAIAVIRLRRGHDLVTARARFVRNVSHELRTPLQQVLLFTDLLRSDRLKEPEKRKEALDIMHAETLRLIALSQNILQFSSNQHASLRLVSVDLSALVEQTVQQFGPLARASDAEIQLVVEQPSHVDADEDALRRVLVNLLDNAVKYGPSGQTITVRVGTYGPWGEVSVCDRGPGIPVSERSLIWQPFRRLEREEAGSTAGSGIGLSIVRTAVDAMSGEVEVTDAQAGGSCFRIRLPKSRTTP